MQDELVHGIELFNRKEFFDCHKVLEEIWIGERGGERFFYQGLINLAVGFFHYQNKNRKGAENQLAKGITKLTLFKPAFFGIEITQFLLNIDQYLQQIEKHDRLPIPTGPIKIPQIQLL